MSDDRAPGTTSRIFLNAAPRMGSSFEQQLAACLQSLDVEARAVGLDRSRVLAQTIFLRAEGGDDYFSKQRLGTSMMAEFYGAELPATSFVAQYPDQGKLVSLDAVLQSPADQGEIRRKKLDSIPYTVVESSHLTELHVGGLAGGADAPGASEQCRQAFAVLARVLANERMDFSHIVRQWSYLENLLASSAGQPGVRQNYQVFNDQRSSCYGQARFSTGYPAATGIGMHAGGVVLACIALRPGADVYVAPLSSPLQIDAHGYTQEVLVGDRGPESTAKAAPLFERAKIVVQGGAGIIHVSGTAAIRGEQTIARDDVRAQTAATIENIDALISATNLSAHGIEVGSAVPRLCQLRAYVKRAQDLPLVARLCRDRYGEIPARFVVADVCRHQLLVEIEATASVAVQRVGCASGGRNGEARQ